MSLINTTINNTSDSTTWLLQLSLWPLRIVCPLLIILCPIANWICISVFQSRIYSRSSSKWYFIFIAIFDTIYVLVTAPLIFLITFEIYILNWSTLFCKLIVFLNYLACQISAGLLACLSIDRLLATSCLMLYRSSCTANVSKYVCACVILLLSIINSHYLIGYRIDSHGFCSARYYQWYGNIYSYLNVVYLLSYSIIPFTIITICNIFIVISVCQNKANMKKKYLAKKPELSLNNVNDPATMNRLSTSSFDKKDDPTINNNKIFRFDRYSEDIKDQTSPVDKRISNNSDREWPLQQQNRLSEKLLLDNEETITPTETSPVQQNPSFDRERLSSNRLLSTASTYSQKMCMQLQITISLLAISICFIFCTLPNCISTIMIQTHIENEQVRKVWQAMNYLSIIPLLITHSVNLIFYYVSSNMFRCRFREYYLRKTNPRKNFSLASLFKSDLHH